MTGQECRRFAELYAEGYEYSKIAILLGYSAGTLRHYAADHRERFPYRRANVDRKTREIWTARVLAGRFTARKAAELLGIKPNTVRAWVRAARKERMQWTI